MKSQLKARFHQSPHAAVHPGQFWVNEPGRVFVARRGRSELTTTILAPGELGDLVERMLRTSGRRIDMSTPFVDTTMPDGSRLHVVIPDMIEAVLLTCADLPQQVSDQRI